MNETRILKFPGKLPWAIALCMGLLLAGDARAAKVADSFRFISPAPGPPGRTPDIPKTQIVVQKAWTKSDKQRIIAAIKKIYRVAPGLIERATFFGKIKLRRSSFAAGEGPLASAIKTTNTITFTDKFFKLRKGRGWLTVVHEITHLADPINVTELSAEWDRLVRPLCGRIHKKLSKDGITLAGRPDWLKIEKKYGRYAREQGMPRVYSCLNWSETLATNVQAMLGGYRPSKQIKSFIDRNYLKTPYRPSPAVIAFKEVQSRVKKGSTDQAIAAYTQALSAYPELKILYRLRGYARQRKRDYAGALADYGKAIENFRRIERKRLVAGIYYQRARVFVRMRDYKAAVAAYDRALEFNPGWIRYLFDRGKILLERTKEPRRAISDFTEILKRRPDSVPIYLARAKALKQIREFTRMDADFAAAIKLRPDYAQSYYQRAYTYKKRGLCKQAIADFARVIALKETSLLDNTYTLSAQCRESINDYRGAIADWTGAIKSMKRWARYPIPDINAARGLAYYKAGQRKEAFKDLRLVLRLIGKYSVATFTRMIEWKPEDPAGYSFRGQAYTLKGDYGRAIADFTRAIEIQPRSAMAYTRRGWAYAARKDYVRSFADFSRAIEIQPGNVTAYARRGQVYTAMKDHESAIADYTRAIEIQPENDTAYIYRGKAYTAKQDHGRAIADFTRAITIKPKNAIAYTLRGKAYSAKQDHDRAIADFTSLIAIQRTPAQKIKTYIERGKAYTARKDYVRALADFDWVIGKYPKAWIAIADRARTHELQGNTSAAIRDLTEALRLKPRHKLLTQRLKALTSSTRPR